jgi:hypothetical protein
LVPACDEYNKCNRGGYNKYNREGMEAPAAVSSDIDEVSLLEELGVSINDVLSGFIAFLGVSLQDYKH